MCAVDHHDLDALEVVVDMVRASVPGFAIFVVHFVGRKGQFPLALTVGQKPVVTAHSWLIRTAEFHPVEQTVNLVQLFVFVNDVVHTQMLNSPAD